MDGWMDDSFYVEKVYLIKNFYLKAKVFCFDF